MQQLIVKNDISPTKMDALIQFLKSWDIDIEIKSKKKALRDKKEDFSLSVGIWKDRNIDSRELRAKAWNRNL